MPTQPIKAFVPELPGVEVDEMVVGDDHIIIYAHGTAGQGRCPECGQHSSRVHSHYVRRPQDLSCSGKAVQLKLTLKRFRCSNTACPRKTFVEALPELVKRRSQRTDRCGRMQQVLGLALGGEAGTRLAAHLGISTSADTLLRLVRKRLLPPIIPPRWLGIDDWAWRKGARYGTVLCDLERHCIIDILPNCEQESVVKWLQRYPEVELITRDRSVSFRESIALGAPQAQQVADRFHLLMNLRQAVQIQLKQHRPLLRWTPPPVEPDPNSGVLRSSGTQRQREATDARRLARYQQIMALREQRYSDHEIAQRLGISARTVQRWRTKRMVVERHYAFSRTPILAPYAEYLTQRWEQGCHDVRQLWTELQNQGFHGTITTVRNATKRLAKGLSAVRISPLPPPSAQRLTPAKAGWIFVLPPERLDDSQRPMLSHLLSVPLLANLYQLVQDFGDLLRQRQPDRLLPWIETVRLSPFDELVHFANGLEKDLAAVLAALSLEWSNGPTEGHVNRLKFIKRQMYGRAKFDLLRARLLHPD